MANSKISALTSATTPLVGTEVLPIVQSGATKQVSVSNLTTGRSVSMADATITGSAATYVLDVTGTEQIKSTSGINLRLYTASGAPLIQFYPNAAGGRTTTLYATDNSSGIGGGLFAIEDTSSTNRVTFKGTTGDVTLSSGNLIPGTAAKGINFTANTPASGMTSQLLNWYEEGTFTPFIAGATVAGTQTYSVQAGFYTRIGNRVTYNLRVVMTAKDVLTSGSLYVGGLPFTSNATANDFNPAAVSNAGFITLSAGYTQITAEIQPSGTVIYLGQAGSNVAFSLLSAATALNATTRISLFGSYMI